MPISTTPQENESSTTYGLPMVTHENLTQFTITISPWPPTEGDADTAVQDLLDYLNAWPKLAEGDPLEARKSRTDNYLITPTEE